MEIPEMDLFARLKSAVPAEWSLYVDHAYLHQMQNGTLPQKAFRFYLVQDYLFLIQFARAKALAIYKSKTLEDMRFAKRSLSTILDVEMDLHVRLCQRWGLTAAQLEAAPEHAATVAYTRFVLDCGISGDLLDLHVAMAPCVIGYGEIGSRLKSAIGQDIEAHPYREWVSEYADENYQTVVAAARQNLDRLAAGIMTEHRFEALSRIFATASRLEADFWQMALEHADA
jgi:thiaminase (transcriptional activator TenA)